MTPIQQHEQELCTLMERAGAHMDAARRGDAIIGTTATASIRMVEGRVHVARCIHISGDPTREPYAHAEHADPRVALRACLEMSGLLRPPIHNEVQPQSEHGPRWRVVVTMGGVVRHGEWQAGHLIEPDATDNDARYLRALGEAIGAVDRPPMTDNELDRWLTERHGQPKLLEIHRIHWESANTWHDPTRPDSMSWWSLYGGERVWTDARTCGLRLWAAERFPERP